MAEDKHFDVVVLGSGIAGLAAALAAHAHGLRVALVEKTAVLGGTSSDSYGLVWAGANHLLLADGQQDAREDIVAYMTFLGGGELDEHRMLTLVDRSPEALRFFETCGIRFQLTRGMVDQYYGVAPGARGAGRTIEAPLISGFELGAWRDRVRTPAHAPYCVTAEEQMHWGGINRVSFWDTDLVRQRQKDDMRGKGVGLVTHFVKQLLARHIPILLEEKGDRLMYDGKRVRGVELASGRQLTAARGVVLATGGYEWNAELMRDLDPLPGLQPQSSPGSTGDGLIMGTEIGAALRRTQNNLNLMLGFTLVLDDPSAPPIGCMAGITELCSPHTIVVNARGRRFGDESYFQSLVPALRTFDTMRHAYANLPCFLIFDQQYAEHYALASLPAGQAIPRSVAHAHAIEDLARTMGIDSTGLQRTIDRFNGFVLRGIDEDFHRGALRWRLAQRDTAPQAHDSLGTLAKPPFYGLELHPTLGTTSAGLLTDQNGQVMHQRRTPIAGLYAAGIVAARSELGAGYQAGLNLASGLTFSYLAVRHMLQRPAAEV